MNKEQSQANQDAVTVTQDGSDITISGNLSTLNSFASTNAAQGSGKWIGLDIGTDLSSIVGATWDGSELTQADVDEAASVGLGAGHIVFWGKAANLLAGRTITIGAADHEDAVFTIKFVNTAG